jgi:uncharacterized membrane protein
MLADSLLGATVQGVYFCESCGSATEDRLHVCGKAARRRRGVAWLDNDAVNFSATGVGAAVGWVVWFWV